MNDKVGLHFSKDLFGVRGDHNIRGSSNHFADSLVDLCRINIDGANQLQPPAPCFLKHQLSCPYSNGAQSILNHSDRGLFIRYHDLVRLIEWVSKVGRGIEGLFYGANRNPAHQVLRCPRFIVGAGCPRSSKWLLPHDCSSWLVIDVKIARRMA